MGLKSETKTVGQHTYRVTQLPAGASRRLLLRMLKIAGPAFVEVMAAQKVNKETGEKEVPDENIASAVSSFADRLHEEDMEHLISTLVEGGTIEAEFNGTFKLLTKETADIHFGGILGEMFRVIGFALEVNYADFFDEVGGLAGLIRLSQKQSG